MKAIEPPAVIKSQRLISGNPKINSDQTQTIKLAAIISADAVLLFVLPLILLTGWARPRWMQWVGGLGVFAVGVRFLVAYTITN
jgi:hypothetical protein